MSKPMRGHIDGRTPFVKINVGIPPKMGTLEAIVDTGCTLNLVMSRREAVDLGLHVIGVSDVGGAFNNKVPVTVFVGFISDWFGTRIPVTVYAPVNCPKPLIGMGLLGDKTISLHNDDNDVVHIAESADCRRVAGSHRKCPIR